MSTTQKLKEIATELTVAKAPRKTERMGEHVEIIAAIGKDETATITMTKEAYDTLMKQEWVEPEGDKGMQFIPHRLKCLGGHEQLRDKVNSVIDEINRLLDAEREYSREIPNPKAVYVGKDQYHALKQISIGDPLCVVSDHNGDYFCGIKLVPVALKNWLDISFSKAL